MDSNSHNELTFQTISNYSKIVLSGLFQLTGYNRPDSKNPKPIHLTKLRILLGCYNRYASKKDLVNTCAMGNLFKEMQNDGLIKARNGSGYISTDKGRMKLDEWIVMGAKKSRIPPSLFWLNNNTSH